MSVWCYISELTGTNSLCMCCNKPLLFLWPGCGCQHEPPSPVSYTQLNLHAQAACLAGSGVKVMND